MPETTLLGPEDAVHCPIDELDFRPYFTEGTCPVCGWAPEGVEIARPWTHRADWALIAYACLVVTSIVMAILVLRAA